MSECKMWSVEEPTPWQEHVEGELACAVSIVSAFRSGTARIWKTGEESHRKWSTGLWIPSLMLVLGVAGCFRCALFTTLSLRMICQS